MQALSTLCYIEKDDKYLMLHRVVKENDINRDKWIGVGGHFLDGESPEDCLLREVREETGFMLTSYKFRGIVTFVYGEVTEYMHLFTADAWNCGSGTRCESPDAAGDDSAVPGIALPECDEGVLEWVPKSDIYGLDIWEGDKIFFDLLERRNDFFSLKLVYNSEDKLVEAVLDGVGMIGF